MNGYTNKSSSFPFLITQEFLIDNSTNQEMGEATRPIKFFGVNTPKNIFVLYFVSDVTPQQIKWPDNERINGV